MTAQALMTERAPMAEVDADDGSGAVDGAGGDGADAEMPGCRADCLQ